MTMFGEKSHVILLAGLTFLSLINAAGLININDTTFIDYCEPNYTISYECVDGRCVRNSCYYKCPSESQKICSSDDKTYSNQCELKKQNCINMTNIVVRHNGNSQNCTEYKLKLSREDLFPNIHLMVLSSIRRWKFKYYDLNNDGKLQHSDLLTEIYNLIGTKSFQVQVEQLFVSKSNNSISKQEWDNCFTISESNSNKRRDILLRGSDIMT